MGDIIDDQIFDIAQVTLAGDNIEVEPPATAGRRRRKNCGRWSSAKPRGRVRKATSDTGAKRGRARQARAAAEAFVATAAAVAATPQRTGHGGCVKAGTAEEVPLETVTAESESTIDLQAEMYVANILPDPATINYPERGSVQAASCSDNTYPCCEEPPTPPPQRRRGGRVHRPTPVRRRRRMAVDGDERVVCKVQSGRWSSLLPVGTVVRRPSVKLVQLVAQAIHESPHRVLRVTHVYAALQNRYPYYWLQDKKGISSWKSSVRHALFQKWFMKLRPTSGMYETIRPRSFFWGLNYSNRWVGVCACVRVYVTSGLDPMLAISMPQGVPRLFVPADHEGVQRDDEASTLCSGLHLNTESPSKTKTALRPSAFRLELEHELFAPPEPQSPGVKRNLSTVPVQRVAAGDVACAVGGRPGLRRQPSFLASPHRAGGLAEVREPESRRLAGAGESGGAGLAAAKCQRLDHASQLVERHVLPTDFLMAQATQQGGVVPNWLRSQDAGRCPYNPLENISTNPLGVLYSFLNHYLGPVSLDNDDPLAPCPPLCSPSYVTLTPPSQTPVPTASSTRAQTPSQQSPVTIPGPSQTPEEVVQRPMSQEQPSPLDNILSGHALLSAEDQCFAFVNAARIVWNNLVRHAVVRRSAASRARGRRVRIAALVVAPPSTPFSTHVENGGLLSSDEADRPSTSSDERRSSPANQADCGKPGSPPT
ncbi:hypothetical protein HPB49_021265 [Dermacentor silvarum]|uniref:Uncharacterized protein n=1 Tax=Dermacentor silvarum TaxID=543639 RepID=A0ACB8DKW7_DERSI|nr:hypothetical protein HPB49_021265 [Dermacentor silvarum]